MDNVLELKKQMGYEVQMYAKSFEEICNAPHPYRQ